MDNVRSRYSLVVSLRVVGVSSGWSWRVMPGMSDWHEVGVAVSSEVVVKREARDAKLD